MVRSTELLNVSRVFAGMRARVVLIYLAALVPALAMAALQPLWSRIDEAQHADVLAQYAHGVVPIEGVTMLQPEIVAVDAATGVYRWYPPGFGPPPGEGDPQAFVPPPASASASARQAWMARHLWGYSYEAMQPPLYYLLAEPDWLLGERFGGTVGAIYAVRIFSALIAACLAPLVYLLALMIRPGAERMALIAAGLGALAPGYVLNTTQITNDGLAAVLGAGLTLAAVKGVRDGWSRPLAVACGVLLGAAAMTKLTTAGLAPLVALAFLWPNAQPLRSRLTSGMIAAAVAAVIVVPWLLFNLHTYRQLVPSHATRALLGAVFTTPSLTAGYLRASARQVVDEFVAGEPFAVMPLTRLLVWFAEGCMLLAAIGLWISRRGLRLEWLLLAGAAADLLWVVGTPYLSGIGGLMPGRYFYPAAAAAFVLVATGIDALPSMLARVTVAAGGAGAVLALVLLVSSQFGLVVPHHAVPEPSAGSAVNVQGDAAGLHVVADRVWVTDGGRGIWVHVTLTNRAPQPVDFPPIPAATTASGAWLFGDYANSTPFPERLRPGESVSGWLRFTRASSSPLKQIHVTYTPITADGYSTLQTLALVVAP
ncbi:MAG TPA: phospholipid carrier-dependent glycosyltransferase [Candidatus Dormibacteraeota bacterium]|nr:phospholipid carrier-dependent glycosyltransferase [Candidatus Dormibacteraeota bacterium]